MGKARASGRPVTRGKKPVRKQARPSKPRPAEEQLQVAMEELVEARGELSRLGHALSASHRELEERKLSSGSAEENLRSQMLALREELRSTLAELEISRNEVERLRGKLAQYEAASASRKPAGSSPSV
jgi:chromosome segregation ATPase